MFTRVYVVLDQKDSARVVPSTSVVSRSGEHGIFLVDSTGTQVRYYPVRTGIVADERTEILAPDLDGLVVTLGQHLLEDGSPILLPEGNVEEQENASSADKVLKDHP